MSTIIDKVRKINSNTQTLEAGPGMARLWVNSSGDLKLNIDGTVTTVGASADPSFNTVKVGDLAVSNTLDPIYATPLNSFLLQGHTATKTDHNNFIDYLAVSVEPDAASAGIYTGRETLMYLPATNTHKVNQVYGAEDFVQSFSDMGGSIYVGRHISVENFAGPITGRATALLLNVENDSEGVVVNGTRGLYVRGAQNYGSTSTVTTHEAIKIDAGSNFGVVGANYGLRIIDQTIDGVDGVNHAIDCNGKFVVGADGSGVIAIPITSDPHIAGAVWNDSGTLTISEG